MTVAPGPARSSPRLTHSTLLHGVQALCATDRQMARIVESYGPPPLWSRRRGYATLVRIILEQQVSLSSAAALYTRLERELAGTVTPVTVLELGTDGLRQLGFTRQKARYVAELAQRVVDGKFSLERIARMPDEQALQALASVTGIGPWTAGVYALMALGRPDIWPPGDLGLHKSLAEVHGLDAVPRSDEAAAFALRWRPWRAVAARLLWHSYLSRRNARW